MNYSIYLLGVITALSLAVSLFFLKFWRGTRDTIFLAFSFFFFMEAINRFFRIFSDQPNVGSTWSNVSRLVTSLLILAAIVRKNLERNN
jgi:uncharacterized membrane protein HdeD (DUF308 family)